MIFGGFGGRSDDEGTRTRFAALIMIILAPIAATADPAGDLALA